MKSKTTAFDQTTEIIQFLYNLIKGNGQTLPENMELSLKNGYAMDITNFDRTQQWINYCKFVMMFSRENKRAYLDQNMVANCVDGHFEGVYIHKKDDAYPILRKYNLDSEILQSIRRAYMFYELAKDKTNADAEFREKYKNRDDIYDFVKFVPGRGYVPVGKHQFALDKNNKLIVTVNDAVGIQHVITYDSDGNVKLDFFTNPLVVRKFDGSPVDNKQSYNLKDIDIINYVRNAIAHNGLYYVSKDKCLRTHADNNGLTLDIPLGWLVQMCNYYVTNTFTNINVLNPTFVYQNRPITHRNNQFIMQFYPNTERLETFDDVVNMLNNRLNFVITINDNAKYFDIHTALERVYHKFADKEISKAYIANTIKKDIISKLRTFGLTNVDVQIVQEPIDEATKDFWHKFLNDSYLFFKHNVGEVPSQDQLMKHMFEIVNTGHEAKEIYQNARVEFVIAALRLMDDDCVETIKKYKEMYRSLTTQERSLASNEKVFREYLKKHHPEHHKVLERYEKIVKKISLRATLVTQIEGAGEAMNYFDPVYLLDKETSAKYVKVIQDYLATIPTRKELEQKEHMFREALRKIPPKELLQYHSFHSSTEIEKHALSKRLEKAKYGYAITPTEEAKQLIIDIQAQIDEKDRLDNQKFDELLLSLKTNYPEVYALHKELSQIKEDIHESNVYAKVLKMYLEQEQEFQKDLTYRRFEIIWDMEAARHNNISKLISGGTDHISSSTLLNLMDVINNLGLTETGDKMLGKISVTKNDLETLLTNKRENLVALAIYQTYSALVETGFEQVLLDVGQGSNHTRKKDAIAVMNSIDMSPFTVTYANTTRQLDEVKQRHAILYRMRSALVHGNVTIKDYFDYKDDPKDIIVCFNKDKYDENDYDMTVECSVDNLIKVFSKDMFELKLDKPVGSATVVYENPTR